MSSEAPRSRVPTNNTVSNRAGRPRIGGLARAERINCTWPGQPDDPGTNFSCVSPLNLHSCRNLRDSWDISLGARLRWVARADNKPTAIEGGDPSGTHKRWFGRVSGRAGWWRGSSLVGTSYWLRGHRGMRAGLRHARDRVQWMDAPMQLPCGLPGARSLGPYVSVLEQEWRSPRGLRRFLLGGQ
jgi:hypothetical protein